MPLSEVEVEFVRHEVMRLVEDGDPSKCPYKISRQRRLIVVSVQQIDLPAAHEAEQRSQKQAIQNRFAPIRARAHPRVTRQRAGAMHDGSTRWQVFAVPIGHQMNFMAPLH